MQVQCDGRSGGGLSAVLAGGMGRAWRQVLANTWGGLGAVCRCQVRWLIAVERSASAGGPARAAHPGLDQDRRGEISKWLAVKRPTVFMAPVVVGV